MLSPAERDLVRRDAGLPGLGTLLDAEAFLAALRDALPSVPVTRADLGYLRYKPATNTVASYRLTLDRGFLQAYAKTFGPADCSKVARDLKRASAAGEGARLVALRDGCTLVRLFPQDPGLTALPALVRASGRGDVVHPALGPGRLRELGYKPERRWVGRFDPAASGAGPFVLKLHAPLRFSPALAGARAFRDSGPLRLAPLCLSDPRRRLLGFGWLPGQLLSDSLGEGSATPAMLHTVGQALARLHRQEVTGLAPLARSTEAATLRATADGVAWLLPLVGGRVSALAERLAARLASAPGILRPLHGDFYAKQVLVDGDRAGVLDLDSAVLGDPASDLGRFLAHLERESLRGGGVSAVALAAALLAGYKEEAGRVPHRVGLYVASTLLRLAPDPFRHREPHWARRTIELLERAEALSAAGETGAAA